MKKLLTITIITLIAFSFAACDQMLASEYQVEDKTSTVENYTITVSLDGFAGDEYFLVRIYDSGTQNLDTGTSPDSPFYSYIGSIPDTAKISTNLFLSSGQTSINQVITDESTNITSGTYDIVIVYSGMDTALDNCEKVHVRLGEQIHNNYSISISSFSEFGYYYDFSSGTSYCEVK